MGRAWWWRMAPRRRWVAWGRLAPWWWRLGRWPGDRSRHWPWPPRRCDRHGTILQRLLWLPVWLQLWIPVLWLQLWISVWLWVLGQGGQNRGRERFNH